MKTSFAKKDESLTYIYTMFTCFINDLFGVSIVKDNLDVVEKFLNVLP